MAMPRKKRRTIDVGGRRYAWCADLRGAVGDLTVTCQDGSGRGALLLVKARHVDPWCRISVETGTLGKSLVLPPDEAGFVAPSFVREAILFGLSAGWNPQAAGKPVVLRYHDQAFCPE